MINSGAPPTGEIGNPAAFKHWRSDGEEERVMYDNGAHVITYPAKSSDGAAGNRRCQRR